MNYPPRLRAVPLPFCYAKKDDRLREREEKYMKHSNITYELVDHAREMRKGPTDEENKIWHILLKHIKPRFTRQKIIGSYIVDFYCPKLKLIIEIDGEQHYLEENAEYEKRRDDFFEKAGYMILRFSNSDINKKISDVERTILSICEERKKEIGLDIEIKFKE